MGTTRSFRNTRNRSTVQRLSVQTVAGNAAPQDCDAVDSQRSVAQLVEFTVWSLHLLPAPEWFLFWHSSLLPQARDMHVRLTR